MNLILWNSQLIFHMFWRSHFIFSHENHWVAWSFWIKNISKWNSNLFKTLFIYLNGRSHVIFSRGFCDERIWIHGDHKSKNESLGKSFYSLSFNFQKVSNFTQFHTLNQTINQNYLFNITFQNLEFWDFTNLPPLKWISSSRFGEARKK